jgi:hypothetical protein
MQEKEAKDKKIATQKVLTLIFPEYKVLFTPNSLLFRKESETIIVDSNNLEDLVNPFIHC